jgi:uncharacterized membrane protein YccC
MLFREQETNSKTPMRLHQGLITALACWLAAVLAFGLHLDNPWWAAISAWVVANPERFALLEKAGNRIVGTLIGCVLGYWLALWCEGRSVLQLVAMFIIAALGVYGRFRSARSYAWIIGSVGGLAIFSTSMETPREIYHFALFRTSEVICGVVASTFIEILLRPQNPVTDPAASPVKRPAIPASPSVDRKLALRLAMIGGTTIVLIPILWSRLYLPSLSQIVISSLVVLDRDAASTHFRGLQRILGCFAGGVFGLSVIRLGTESFLVWSAMLIGGVFVFALLHHGGSRWSYVGTQGGIAVILALITGQGPPDSILPAVGRIAGMLCGVAILILVCFVCGHPGSEPAGGLTTEARKTQS